MIVIVLVVLAASAAPGSAATGSRRLPPADRDTLAEIFDPMLRDLGLRTTRARLQDAETYEVNPRGRHMAVYVEPLSESFTDAEYVSKFMEVAQVYLPAVFERWRGLKSFDVCLEPLPSENARRAPPPVTQLAVDRGSAQSFAWSDATLADALAEGSKVSKSGDERQFYVYFASRLDQVPELVSARAAAANANDPQP